MALAIAEMAMGGGLGARADLGGGQPETVLAFAETLGRLIVEVTPQNAAAFERALAGQPFARIGEVTAKPSVQIVAGGRTVINATLPAIAHAFRGHLTEAV